MSLRVWLPLRGSLENLGTDTVALTNSGATSNNNGKIGRCYNFNGSAYMVSTGTSLDIGIKSVCFWAYITNTGNYLVFTDYKSGLAFGVYSSYIPVSCSASNTTTYPKTSIELNQWNHVAVVKRDSSTIELWINGEKQTKGSTSDRWSSGITDKLSLGARPNGNDKLNGYLNDFRMYDHALSAKEIHEISKALVLHFPLDNNGFGGDNLLLNSENLSCHKIGTSQNEYWACNVGQSFMDVPSGTEVTISFDLEMYVGTAPVTYFQIYNTNNKGPKQITSVNVGSQIGALNPSVGDTVSLRIVATTTIVDRSSPTISDNYIEFYSTYDTDNLYNISNIKVELGDTATPWSPTSDSTTVYDCSGYHNDAILHNITTATDTPRYSACSEFASSNSSYIKVQDNTWMAQGVEELTVNFWANPATWSGQTKYMSCTESGGFNTEGGNSGYIRFPVNVYTNEAKTSSAYKYSSNELKISDILAGWHMLTFQLDSTGNKVYLDGELHSSRAFTNYGVHYNLNARLFLGCEANTANPSGPYYTGEMSDFRIYYSALSPEDIKELYEVRASVDNLQNDFTYEFVEQSVQNPSLTKQGILISNSFVDYFNEHEMTLYDPDYYTEPDGSVWIRIVHHNNPASKLFASTNDFVNRVYIDADRWFDASICNFVSRWELMVKQKIESTSSETKWRWIQFVNPMEATFNETKAANVVKITTSGYSNNASAGGVIHGNSSNTFFTINNGASGNWYGAIGCWTAYQGGIPGYPNTVVKTGYIDLYLRIDDPGIYKNSISAKELIEI